MSLLTQVTVIWFGVNLLVLALMWFSAEARRRQREAHAADSQRNVTQAPLMQAAPVSQGLAKPTLNMRASNRPAPDTTASGPDGKEPGRVVALINGDVSGRRSSRHTTMALATGSAHHCDCEALQTEIRTLRLTVAELSIDRARLLSKQKPSPWKRPAGDAQRLERKS